MTSQFGQPRRQKPMRLLCLGLPRTSTESLRSALFILGFEGVYHGWALAFERPEDAYIWTELSKSRWNYSGKQQPLLDREAFGRVLGDVEAVTDAPGCYLAYDLMQAYPEAKILLNTRDFASWNASWQKAIVPVNKRWDLYLLSFLHPLWWVERNLYTHYFVQYFDGSYEYNTKKTYDTHHALIRQLAAEQGRDLLEWTVKDGWDPLCKFLDVPVPAEPFPSGNDAAAYEARARQKAKNITKDCVRWVSYGSAAAALLGGAVVLSMSLMKMKRP